MVGVLAVSNHVGGCEQLPGLVVASTVQQVVPLLLSLIYTCLMVFYVCLRFLTFNSMVRVNVLLFGLIKDFAHVLCASFSLSLGFVSLTKIEYKNASKLLMLLSCVLLFSLLLL